MLYGISARPQGSDFLLSCTVYVYQQDLVEKALLNNARKVNFACCFLLHSTPRVYPSSEMWKYLNMSAIVLHLKLSQEPFEY